MITNNAITPYIIEYPPFFLSSSEPAIKYLIVLKIIYTTAAEMRITINELLNDVNLVKISSTVLTAPVTVPELWAKADNGDNATKKANIFD